MIVWRTEQEKRFAKWRSGVQWAMRQRIFLAQHWGLSPEDTDRLHRWIDEFAGPTEAQEERAPADGEGLQGRSPRLDEGMGDHTLPKLDAPGARGVPKVGR